MTWSDLLVYALVFIMGAYAGSSFEMSRFVNAARRKLTLGYKGKVYRVEEVKPS